MRQANHDGRRIYVLESKAFWSFFKVILVTSSFRDRLSVKYADGRKRNDLLH